MFWSCRCAESSEESKYFLAPYSRRPMRLSPSCRDLTGDAARLEDVDTLRSEGLEWQLTEGVVSIPFIMNTGEPDGGMRDYNHWEFCHNPAPQVELNVTDVVDDDAKQANIDSSVRHMTTASRCSQSTRVYYL
jgi:hypothetical protein